MPMIELMFRYNGKLDYFRCTSWDIYNSWLPYNGTEPIKMVVTDEIGRQTAYTEFRLERRERLGCSFSKIVPIE